MLSFLQNLLNTAGFPPRWQCGDWSDAHAWLHIVSDTAIFGAYFAIPVVLGYFVLRRRDVPFLPIFWLFAAFILWCGIGHAVEATLFWHPWYRLSGLIKSITAVVSWATVLALVPILPKALTLPGLAKVNQQLQQEIEERKRAEERMKLAVQASPSGMVMMNRDGVIVMVNSRTEIMFGYQSGELLGQPIEALVPERLRKHHPSLRAAFLQHPQARAMGEGRDLYGVRKDGTEFPVEIGLNPIETDEGTFVLSAIVDITTRKQAEEQIRRSARELERSNEELDRFAYSASHDLKAPLRAIDNLARWIAEDAGHLLPKDARADLDLMMLRIARMERLLDDLLTYSRVGRIAHKPATIDTGTLAREVVALLAPPRTFTIRVGNLPALTTHKAPLEQVFLNLVGNAIKHHDRKDGLVEIAAQDQGAFIEFSVRDDGPGIPPEFHEQVFQMFQTLKPRDQVEGSGMGLALVKKIVENQGGKMVLESSPGHGATFRFTWPKTLRDTMVAK